MCKLHKHVIIWFKIQGYRSHQWLAIKHWMFRSIIGDPSISLLPVGNACLYACSYPHLLLRYILPGIPQLFLQAAIFWSAWMWRPTMGFFCQSHACSIGKKSGDFTDQGKVVTSQRQSRKRQVVEDLAWCYQKIALEEHYMKGNINGHWMYLTYYLSVKVVHKMTRSDLLIRDHITLGIMTVCLCKK